MRGPVAGLTSLRTDYRRYCVAAAMCAALCLALAGCRSADLVELRETPSNPLSERLALTARGGARPSGRTMQILRRYDLAANWDAGQQKAIPELVSLYEKEPSPEICFALAELNYVSANRSEMRDHNRALALYWNSVLHAYTYLFDPKFDPVRNPYDPEFRRACDVYNTSLESCLRITRNEGKFRPGESVSFTVDDQQVDVTIEAKGFNWKPDEFDHFEFVSDYRVNGLKNVYRTFGLGVPLIAIRKRGVDQPEVEKHYAGGLSFPVTAFMRLDPERDTGATRQRHLHLELHDPLKSTEIDVAGTPVPMESDISTPLAYFLANPSFHGLESLGLLRVDKAEKIAGIYMVQPYQPGKIPVVMIHGLWSSPMTWMEAFNDLQSMPDIREKYQFWFYLYPTGRPFWESAAELRDNLASVRQQFAPRETTNSLNEMVLVGHSMGGLVARMQTVESEDNYWQTVSDEPFSALEGDDKLRQHFEKIYFFHPDPGVRRVVTIGSPHRGSDFSNPTTRWITRMVTFLPEHTYQAASRILVNNAKIIKNPDTAYYMTGVDSLTPKSPILNVLHETKPSGGVKQHNIIGIIKPDVPQEENTDGIVTYASAHLEGVESEIVVPASHIEVHRHPRTVLEIRRILREHLAEVESEHQGDIIQIDATGHSVEAAPVQPAK